MYQKAEEIYSNKNQDEVIWIKSLDDVHGLFDLDVCSKTPFVICKLSIKAELLTIL